MIRRECRAKKQNCELDKENKKKDFLSKNVPAVLFSIIKSPAGVAGLGGLPQASLGGLACTLQGTAPHCTG